MQERKCDVVISGMGPSGLADAWKTVKNGQNTLVISNRTDDFVRVQAVFLDDKSRKFLQEMYNDCRPDLDAKVDQALLQKYMQEIKSGISSLKEIERFMKVCIDSRYGDKIHYEYLSELSAVSLQKGEAVIRDVVSGEEKIHLQFKDIVAADGAHHHAVNVVNEQLPEEEKIMYSPVGEAFHPYHMFSYITLSRKDGTLLDLPSGPMFPAVVQVDGRESAALVFLFNKTLENSSGTKVKCGLSSEIGEELFNHLKENKNNEEALSYIKDIIIQTFRSAGADLNAEDLDVTLGETSKKYGEKKDKLKFSLFTRTLDQANVAAIQAGEHRLFITGDSFIKPDYQKGEGLNLSLREAQLLDQIYSGEISIEDFKDECDFFRKDPSETPRTPDDIISSYYTNEALFKEVQLEALEEALKENDYDKIQNLSELLEAFNISDEDLFNFASASEKNEIIKWLVDRNPTLFQKGDEINPCFLLKLIEAHSKSNNLLDSITYLLGKGVPSNILRKVSSENPFFIACIDAKPDLVQEFIKKYPWLSDVFSAIAPKQRETFFYHIKENKRHDFKKICEEVNFFTLQEFKSSSSERESDMLTLDITTEECSTFISGAGPIGWVCAWKRAPHEDVSILELPDVEENKSITLTSQAKKTLLEIYKDCSPQYYDAEVDKDFLSKLTILDDVEVPLKEIVNFMKTCCLFGAYRDSIKYEKAEICDADLTQGTAFIKDKTGQYKCITFYNAVAADGDGSKILTVFNSRLDKQDTLSYKSDGKKRQATTAIQETDKHRVFLAGDSYVALEEEEIEKGFEQALLLSAVLNGDKTIDSYQADSVELYQSSLGKAFETNPDKQEFSEISAVNRIATKISKKKYEDEKLTKDIMSNPDLLDKFKEYLDKIKDSNEKNYYTKESPAHFFKADKLASAKRTSASDKSKEEEDLTQNKDNKDKYQM